MGYFDETTENGNVSMYPWRGNFSKSNLFRLSTFEKKKILQSIFLVIKSIVAAKINKSLAKEAELDELDSEISDEFKRYGEYKS